MTSEKALFRQVMGQFVTGVTIVTTATPEGVFGLTLNAFTSVSLDPPLIAICVATRSQTLSCVRSSGTFAVNVLTSEQEALSRCFATPSVERSRAFCHVPYHVAVTGSPVLNAGLAFLDARVVAEYPGGDHAILLGQVEAIGWEGTAYHYIAESTAHKMLADGKEAWSNTTDKPGQRVQTPLIYYQGQYRHLARLDEETGRAGPEAEAGTKS